jgi:hypothetical protein
MASKIEKLQAVDRETGTKHTVYPATVGSAVQLSNGEDLNSTMARALYGNNVVFINKAEYDALPEEEQNDGRIYVIMDDDKELILTDTLEAGHTEISFTNEKITENSMIDVYVDKFGISPINIIYSDNTMVLIFDTLDFDLTVKVVVR